MRYLIPILLLTLLVLGTPAVAAQEDSVTLTFELYLSGDVPEGEAFRLALFEPRRQRGGTEAPPLYLCGGPRGELDANPGTETVCVGREEPYIGVGGESKGTTVTYQFYRSPAGNRPNDTEVISERTLRLEEDATIVAHYRYPGGEKPGIPSDLPDTGAGGLAPGTTIPVGNAATGLMMLVGAGYAVLRRR